MEERTKATLAVKDELSNSKALLAEAIEQEKVAEAYAEFLRSKIVMLESQVRWNEQRVHHLESEALTDFTKIMEASKAEEGETK